MSRAITIGVVGYGMGNVRSVLNALEHLELASQLIEKPEHLANVDRVILPGVGAYGAAMSRLQHTGFQASLDRTVKEDGKLLLGICLGMQLLADASSEFGEHRGLGYLPGRVDKLPQNTPNLPLPHMGWNSLELRAEAPLLAGVAAGTDCYFVHSFQLIPDDERSIAATTDYDGPVTAVVSHNNVMGTQFHPEKSQDAGLQILANFAALPC